MGRIRLAEIETWITRGRRQEPPFPFRQELSTLKDRTILPLLHPESSFLCAVQLVIGERFLRASRRPTQRLLAFQLADRD